MRTGTDTPQPQPPAPLPTTHKHRQPNPRNPTDPDHTKRSDCLGARKRERADNARARRDDTRDDNDEERAKSEPGASGKKTTEEEKIIEDMAEMLMADLCLKAMMHHFSSRNVFLFCAPHSCFAHFGDVTPLVRKKKL